MNIVDVLRDPEWDAPFFKRLALYDTDKGKGKQGGLTLYKAFREYMPTLDVNRTSSANPTVATWLNTDLYDGTQWIANKRTRYQYQTWTGKRSPEIRITQISPLHKRSNVGDIMIFQRHLETVDRYRFFLLRAGTTEYSQFQQFVREPTPGLVFAREPMRQSDMDKAMVELIASAQEPFILRHDRVERKTSKQHRIARSVVFRKEVCTEYQMTCAISGFAIRTPNHAYEVQAAHVVPLHEGGSDDIRNGITLTSTLHWAFDRGMIGVLPGNRKVHVPKRVLKLPECAFLNDLAGRTILEARTEAHRLHDDALDWHLKQMTKQWGK